jgi:hypothetical protein
MQTHPANPVVNMPPMSPDGGASSTVLSVEVQSVPAPNVISTNVVLVCFSLVNVPIALNAIVPPVGTPSGPVLTMLVGLADGRGVSVGEGVLPGVGVGGVGVKEGVGEGGAPVEITMDWSEKPGLGVGVGALLLLPEQLSRIAPKTNNKTGATTSHLSHRDNIKPSAMTDGGARCQVDARLTRFRSPIAAE